MTKTDALCSIPWWVVTDLDGTLMDHDYNWEPAREAIRGLQLKGIPVIPCTSKTAVEVKHFRAAVGLKDPYIVENGGAIHGETSDGEPWELVLGCPVAELRPVLLELEQLLSEPLQPIDALSDQEAFDLLGLQGKALQLACTRCWSLPFVPPSASARQRLPDLANRLGFAVVQGNRMGHLLGVDVSKGRALEILKQRRAASPVRVLALGDSPNDQPLLDAGDLSVVVPGANGPHPVFAEAIAQGRYQLASACHAQGWAEAVFQYVLNEQS